MGHKWQEWQGGGAKKWHRRQGGLRWGDLGGRWQDENFFQENLLAEPTTNYLAI